MPQTTQPQKTQKIHGTRELIVRAVCGSLCGHAPVSGYNRLTYAFLWTSPSPGRRVSPCRRGNRRGPGQAAGQAARKASEHQRQGEPACRRSTATCRCTGRRRPASCSWKSDASIRRCSTRCRCRPASVRIRWDWIAASLATPASIALRAHRSEGPDDAAELPLPRHQQQRRGAACRRGLVRQERALGIQG